MRFDFHALPILAAGLFIASAAHAAEPRDMSGDYVMKGKGVHLRYELPQRLRQDLADAGFGAIVRHWLPIVPSRVRGLQPIFESAPIRAAFHAWPWVGSALSHAFVFEALRDMR